MVVARDWEERGNGELLFNEYGVSVLQNEKSSGDGCTIIWMYVFLNSSLEDMLIDF